MFEVRVFAAGVLMKSFTVDSREKADRWVDHMSRFGFGTYDFEVSEVK